jgi:hypothetical protein
MGTLVIVYTKSSYDDIPPTYCVSILIHIFLYCKIPNRVSKIKFDSYILSIYSIIRESD